MGPSMGLCGKGAQPEGQTTGPSLSNEVQQVRWPWPAGPTGRGLCFYCASGTWELHEVAPCFTWCLKVNRVIFPLLDVLLLFSKHGPTSILIPTPSSPSPCCSMHHSLSNLGLVSVPSSVRLFLPCCLLRDHPGLPSQSSLSLPFL